MDKGKGLSNSPPKKKKTRDEEIFEQVRKRLKAEGALLNKRIDILSSFASMKWKSETLTEETTTEETETEGTETDDSIYGTETEESEEESLTNNPKGIKKKKVEQAAENNPTEEIPLVLSPTGSSTSNPKGIKEEIKQIIHEEEEEEEEKKKPKAADSSSDNTCTSTFPPPTSSTNKSLDSGKDESMKSPPGDQGSC